jgi:signal peptidase I
MFLKNLLKPSKRSDAFGQKTAVRNRSAISGLCEDILSQGVAMRIRVTGQSMRPTIHTNDVVVVKRVPVKKIRLGDLLLFKDHQGVLILHRLIKKERHAGHTVYRTKGDSLTIPDAGVSADCILGKVYKIEKWMKSRKTFFTINLESLPGHLFHSAMMALQCIFFFHQRFRAFSRQIVFKTVSLIFE